MKLINKKIIAAALAFATLTGCDSLNNGEKDKVETETDQVETTDSAEDTDAADTDADKDSKDADSDADKDTDADSEDSDSEGGGQNVTTGPDTDDPTKDASPEEESEAVTEAGDDLKSKLEDAIFNNRVQARACEILLENTPEDKVEFRAELESYIQESNDLIEQAQRYLESL